MLAVHQSTDRGLGKEAKMKKTNIAMIAAMGRGRVIGLDNYLPWEYISADMEHFREQTVHKPIIMGRKTFASLGDKPLKDRINVVMSRQRTFYPVGYFHAFSAQEAIRIAEDEGQGAEIMVIGGAAVFQEFMPYANRLYITFINEEFRGNVFFPFVPSQEWREVKRRIHMRGAKSPYDLVFVTLERVLPPIS
ncbi:MAG: dihydrofolate reductase [Patescibacteria group bacterium]|nr:MAG: dihydrofolate reductase [Patescibacteria group bacterium]